MKIEEVWALLSARAGKKPGAIAVSTSLAPTASVSRDEMTPYGPDISGYSLLRSASTGARNVLVLDGKYAGLDFASMVLTGGEQKGFVMSVATGRQAVPHPDIPEIAEQVVQRYRNG